MALKSSCPDADCLQRVALGLLSGPEVEQLEQHLLGCERCVRALEAMNPTDPVLVAVRNQNWTARHEEGDVIDRLIARLETGLATPGEDLTTPDPSPAGPPPVPGEPEAAAVAEMCDLLAPAQGPEEIGRLGNYRVLKVLGSGGMGVVFLAEDPSLQRFVALKAMKPSVATRETVRQRFLREGRATAAIKNDHVVTTYQVGVDGNVPFLAMEFLEGTPLDRCVAEGRVIPIPEVLRIGCEVALGLAAAHEKGLIHRDIKPGNIWLEAPHGRVKILDFGLARISGEEINLTQEGAIVGTPAYMAPEQARGEMVDARSDLFSLGCVLYRLCAGQAPFRGETTMAVLMALMLDTPRPLQEINPNIPRELSDLVERLLARDPEQRPPSALAVVEALQAIERDPALSSAAEPPSRRPVSRRTRGRWWLAAALLVAMPALVVLAGVIIVIRHKDGRETRIEPADGSKVILEPSGKVTVDPSGGKRQPSAPPRPAASPGASAFDALQRKAIPAYELAVAGGGDPERAPKELVAVLGESRFHHGRDVLDLVWSPDGKRLFSGGSDRVRVWDPESGKQALFLPRSGKGNKAFSPDGKWLVQLRKTRPQSLSLCDITGKELFLLQGHTGEIKTVAWARGGKRLASAGVDKTVRVWDAETGKELGCIKLSSPLVSPVALSPEGKRLAGSLDDRVVRIWDAQTGKELQQLKEHTGPVRFLCFSPDSKDLVAADGLGLLTLWDAETGKPRYSLERRSHPTAAPAFSPNGRLLAIGWSGGLVVVREAKSGREVQTLSGHQPTDPSGIAFSPDGRHLATVDQGGAIKIWDVSTWTELVPVNGSAGALHTVAVSSDGNWVASCGTAHTVRVWEAGSGLERAAFHPGPATMDVTFSPDGQFLAVAGYDGSVRLWGWRKQVELWCARAHARIAFRVAFSPDGKRLASGGLDPVAKVRNVETGKEVFALKGHTDTVRGVAFSPDGKVLATASLDQSVKLWDARTGKLIRTLVHLRGVTEIAFSPDGRHLLTMGMSPAKIWDVNTGEELRTLVLQRTQADAGVYSPDGKTIITRDGFNHLTIWEAATATILRKIQLPEEFIAARLAIAPDGRHVLTANTNGTVYVLRLAGPVAGTAAPINPPPAPPGSFDQLKRESIPAYELAVAGGGDLKGAPAELVAVLGDSRLQHGGAPADLAWSPDGKQLLSGGANFVRVWDPETGKQTVFLPGPIDCSAFCPDGKRLVHLKRTAPEVLRICDITGKELLLLAGHRGGIQSVAWALDGKRLASAGIDSTVRVWDTKTGKELQCIHLPAPLFSNVAISPDGKRLGGCFRNNNIQVWDADTGKELLDFTEHTSRVKSLRFSPDGKVIASADGNGGLKVWDAMTGKVRRSHQTPAEPPTTTPAFSPDGHWVGIGWRKGSMVIWDTVSGREVLSLRGQPSDFQSLAFSPDGQRVATGDRAGSIAIWDVATGKKLLPGEGAAGNMDQVSVSRDGKWGASVGRDGTVRIWEAGTGQQRESFRLEDHVLCVTFHPDGRSLALGTYKGAVRVWNWREKTAVWTARTPRASIQKISFSPDGKRLATAGYDRAVRIWDAATGKEVFTLEGHTDEVSSIAFGPDGKYLASGSADQLVKVWDLATGKNIHSLKQPQWVKTVAFAPDGKHLLVTGHFPDAKIWDAVTGEEIRTLAASGAKLRTGIYSPRGDRIITCDRANRLVLWEAATGKPLRELNLVELFSINDLVFAPDGQHVLTANSNGTVYVLRLPPPAPSR
jgi:WD40 repeat protein/serine/threonine protein kinase